MNMPVTPQPAFAASSGLIAQVPAQATAPSLTQQVSAAVAARSLQPLPALTSAATSAPGVKLLLQGSQGFVPQVKQAQPALTGALKQLDDALPPAPNVQKALALMSPAQKTVVANTALLLLEQHQRGRLDVADFRAALQLLLRRGPAIAVQTGTPAGAAGATTQPKVPPQLRPIPPQSLPALPPQLPLKQHPNAGKVDPNADAQQSSSAQPQPPLNREQELGTRLLNHLGVLDSLGQWLSTHPEATPAQVQQQLQQQSAPKLAAFLEKEGFRDFVRSRHGATPNTQQVEQAARTFLQDKAAALPSLKQREWTDDERQKIYDDARVIAESERGRDLRPDEESTLRESVFGGGNGGPPKPPVWWNKSWNNPFDGDGSGKKGGLGGLAANALALVKQHPAATFTSLVVLGSAAASWYFSSPPLDTRYIDPYEVFVEKDAAGKIKQVYVDDSATRALLDGNQTDRDRVGWIQQKLKDVGGDYQKLNLPQARLQEFRKSHPTTVAIDPYQLPPEFFLDPTNVAKLRQSMTQHYYEQVLAEGLRIGGATDANVNASAATNLVRGFFGLIKGVPPVFSTNDWNHPSYWGRTQPAGVVQGAVIDRMRSEQEGLRAYVADLWVANLNNTLLPQYQEKMGKVDRDYPLTNAPAVAKAALSDVESMIKQSPEIAKAAAQDAIKFADTLSARETELKTLIGDLTKTGTRFAGYYQSTGTPNQITTLMETAKSNLISTQQLRADVSQRIGMLVNSTGALKRQGDAIKIQGDAKEIQGNQLGESQRQRQIQEYQAALSAWSTRKSDWNQDNYLSQLKVDPGGLTDEGAGAHVDARIPQVNGFVIPHYTGLGAEAAADRAIAEMRQAGIFNPPELLVSGLPDKDGSMGGALTGVAKKLDPNEVNQLRQRLVDYYFGRGYPGPDSLQLDPNPGRSRAN